MKRLRVVTDFNAIAVWPALWIYVDGDCAIAVHWFCFAIEVVILEER